jgi:hypothetical protein
VGYRDFPPPPHLRELVECAWVVDGPPEPVRVLPDGCMDLIAMSGRVVVAGPDTVASVNQRDREPFVGLRFGRARCRACSAFPLRSYATTLFR